MHLTLFLEVHETLKKGDPLYTTTLHYIHKELTILRVLGGGLRTL